MILSGNPETGKPCPAYRAPNTFTIIPDALKNWPGLNWTDRFIYSRIERYQQQGEAYPSHQTLAREAGIKRRQVLRICRKLQDAGLLKTTRRLKTNSDKLDTCTYEVLKPWRGYVPGTDGLNDTEKSSSSLPDSKNQQQQQQQSQERAA